MATEVIKYAQEVLQTSESWVWEGENGVWGMSVSSLMPCVPRGERNSDLTRHQ
jgi:hypothetical protein